MGRYYILIKRKGEKGWRGAIPAKMGISLVRLKRIVRQNVKRGWLAKVVTKSTVVRLLRHAKRLGRVRGSRRTTRRSHRKGGGRVRIFRAGSKRRALMKCRRLRHKGYAAKCVKVRKGVYRIYAKRRRH